MLGFSPTILENPDRRFPFDKLRTRKTRLTYEAKTLNLTVVILRHKNAFNTLLSIFNYINDLSGFYINCFRCEREARQIHVLLQRHSQIFVGRVVHLQTVGSIIT